eukprot:gene8885-3763_t
MQAEIIFLGTPANVFRMWYPYAPKGAEVVVSLNYQHASRITFQDTPAKVFRLWYPYAPKDADVLVSLNYQVTRYP